MASAEQRKSNGENKVKLADIAKQTGYSLATVSKALNGKADFSEAARQLKIRIPEDLSVIGFDNIQTAAYMGPALTTVRQPLQDMAATAARMVIDTNEGRKIQKRVVLSTSLVVRDSTRRLKSRD